MIRSHTLLSAPRRSLALGLASAVVAMPFVIFGCEKEGSSTKSTTTKTSETPEGTKKTTETTEKTVTTEKK